MFKFVFTKWPPAFILDVRNSPLIAFLVISDRYATFFFFEIFDQMAAVGHFVCPKFTFDGISGHFRSIQSFFLKFLQNGSRCNRLRCPLARMSGLQCFKMGHNGHGINLYGVSI